MQVLGPDQLDPRITRRQQALNQGLNMVLGGIGQIDERQQKEAQTERQRALETFEIEKDLAKQGISLDDNQRTQLANYAKTGDVKGLQGIMSNVATQVQTDKKNKARIEAEERDLNKRYKESMINKNMQGSSALQKNKKLSPTELLKINEGSAIPNMLKDVETTLNQNEGIIGPIAGRLSNLSPYSETARTMEAQLKSSAQAFGRYMEGGVLRKEDEEKYKEMFPKLTDTPEVARNKLQIVNKLLSDKQLSDISALEGAGYDVSSVKKPKSSQLPEILSGKIEEVPLQQVNQFGGVIPRAVAGGDNMLKQTPTDALMKRREELLKKQQQGRQY